jgi:23S rRNA pseudouridine2605 synthase
MEKKSKPKFEGKKTVITDKRSNKKKEEPSFNRYRNDATPADFSDKPTRKPSDKKPSYKKKPYVKKSFDKTRKAVVEKEDDGTVRLNKYIANAGICSRREADDLISSGVIQVNGKVVTEMGYKVNPTDVIKYGGQTLRKEKMVYLILNKPKDYITTYDDPEKRKTVLELIAGACKERIYPVGRLDRNTTGLLMFTNDGDLTKKLTHPRYGVRKVYHVELDKPLKPQDLKSIQEGIELEDGPIKADEIAYVGDGKDRTEVGVEIHSGRNRIVRRIFEHFGYNVRKLDRVVFGSLTKKDLARGRWRFLTEAEIGMLKMVSTKGA